VAPAVVEDHGKLKKGENIMCVHIFASLSIVSITTQVGIAPLGNTFTYQGQIKADGLPISGLVDLKFTLWDAHSGGTFDPDVQTKSNVSVANGLFNTTLDFGPGAFEGSAKWLAIEIRYPAGVGSFVPMATRQPINAAPYALYAINGPGGGGAGGTLDQAYDYGGAGAGRSITADAGDVRIIGPGGLQADGGVHAGAVSIGQATADLDVQAQRSFDPFTGNPPGPTSVGASIIDGNIIIPHQKWAYLRVSTDGNAIRRNSGSTLAFEVEGTINDIGRADSQMLLDGDGNLGIGTDQPQTKLHVLGGSDAEPSGGGSVIIGRTEQTNLALDDNELMARNNGAVSKLSINANGGDVAICPAAVGNVGIGTNTPKGKLDVEGDYYGLGHIWLHAFEGDGQSGTAYVQARDTSNTSHIDLQLRTKDGAGYRDTMRLKANGDVVIPGTLDIGYEIVTANVNDSRSLTVTCPSGKRVLGGGCEAPANNNLTATEPDGITGWYCYKEDPDGYLNVWAICARVK